MPIYPYSFTMPPVNKQDIPSDGVAGEFLGISAGGVLDWLPVAGGGGGGDMLKADNLSGLADYAIARTNIGLGTTSTPTFANLTLTSPSLTSDAPVTISQTWNAVGQTFKALVVNAAGTSDANSAAGSLLADFQTGGVSKAWVTKQGGYRASIGQFVSGNGIGFAGGLNTGFYSVAGEQIFVAANNSVPIEFKSTSIVVNLTTTFGFGQVGVGADTILLRDGADNTLALRNGAAAQTFNVYGTYTSASVYERMFMRYNGTALAFQVGAETLGATARPLEFLTAGTRKLVLTATGNNIATFYSASNSTTNILTLRNLSDVPKFQFYLNPSGNAEAYIGANTLLSETGSSYFNGVNVGIGTTSPTSKLHVAGSSSPSITVDNTLATGASQLLFKNTVVTGDTDGIFLNGSAQSGFGGNGSLNIKATTGPLAFHTNTVTNAFSMAQTGAATFSQGVTFNNDIYGQRDVYSGNGRYFRFANATALSSSAVGLMLLSDLTGVNLSPRIAFGGVDATFPALKRSGTSASFDVVLANDSGFTSIQDLYRRFGAGTPEGVVTAPIGAVYHNTTGGAGTSFYVKESGTGNTGWVGK